MSTPQHFEQTAIGISNGASYIGIGTTVISGLTLSEWGVTAIIQPGGSIRDEECIQAANEHGIAMVFTGHRHFRH